MEEYKIPKDKLNVVLRVCSDIMEVDLKKNTRKRDYVVGRSIYYYTVKKLNLRYSLDEIGSKVDRDHATVLHGLKNFPIDVLGSHKYNPLFQKCLEASKIAIEFEGETMDYTKISHLVEKEMEKHQKEIRRLNRKLYRFTKDPLMRDIMGMDEHQYNIFRERSKVMLKMIKSIKTYENTPRSAFNPS